jgi:RHS repeat-associated protein
MSLGHTNQHDVATQRVTLPRTTGPSQPRYTYDATGKDCVVAVTADASHKEKYVYDASVLPTTPFSRKTADFRCPPSATAMNQESGLYYYGLRFLTTSQARWLSRDPIGAPGFISDYVAMAMESLHAYSWVRNNTLSFVDPLGLSEWRLDIGGDHGGPHIQLGDYRWDAATLEPLEHGGIRPPPLTKAQLRELAKSGVLDRVLKNVPGSVVEQAGKELFGKEFAGAGAKCLTRSAQKELAKSILRKIPIVLLVFATADYAEGGIEKAAKNAVIPGDLIEDVLKESSRLYAEWSDEKAKAIFNERCRCAGFSAEDPL